MGPAEVTAGAVVFLVAVVGVWVVAARRRRARPRRDELERETDDAAVRAQVLRRLEHAVAQWDRAADTAGTVSTAGSADTAGATVTTDQAGGAGTGPVEPNGAEQAPEAAPPVVRPAARAEYAPAGTDPARHGRPGRRIRVRWRPRA